MPLDEGDKAIIREIAFEVAVILKRELKNARDEAIKIHALECPAKDAIKRWPKQITFLAIGIGIGSGGGVALIIKLFGLV